MRLTLCLYSSLLTLALITTAYGGGECSSGYANICAAWDTCYRVCVQNSSSKDIYYNYAAYNSDTVSGISSGTAVPKNSGTNWSSYCVGIHTGALNASIVGTLTVSGVDGNITFTGEACGVSQWGGQFTQYQNSISGLQIRYIPVGGKDNVMKVCDSDAATC